MYAQSAQILVLQITLFISVVFSSPCDAIFSVFAAFPAPLVFGALVDHACLVLQGGGSCSKRSGACLLYDSAKLKNYMHGFVVAIKVRKILICFQDARWQRRAAFWSHVWVIEVLDPPTLDP